MNLSCSTTGFSTSRRVRACRVPDGWVDSNKRVQDAIYAGGGSRQHEGFFVGGVISKFGQRNNIFDGKSIPVHRSCAGL